MPMIKSLALALSLAACVAPPASDREEAALLLCDWVAECTGHELEHDRCLGHVDSCSPEAALECLGDDDGWCRRDVAVCLRLAQCI